MSTTSTPAAPGTEPGASDAPEGAPALQRADLAIVGLGYVGLPLAMAFAQAGLTVLGLDVDPSKLVHVSAGTSWIEDVADADVARHVEAGRFAVTIDPTRIAAAEAVVIAVPTPLNRNREPDLSLVEAATRSIEPHLRDGQLVVLESTTWPGTTREVLAPIIEADGTRTIGEDVFLAYSPERVDPGNERWTVRTTPKVVGGMTEACTERARELYARAIESVHVVSSPDAAELEKLFENIFRNVNIALVNELAILCGRMGIDVWEVIDAAATKPFGFMRFSPGPGLGGHCIPIDPFYLSWKAREYDFSTEFIELAGKINSNMPYHCVRRIRKALDAHSRSLRGSNLVVLGVAYKRDVGDYRESAAIKILELLQARGANVRYHDPHVPRIEAGHGVDPPEAPADESVELSPGLLAEADAVVVLTDHTDIDWAAVREHARVVVDFRNVYAGEPASDELFRL